MIVRLVRLKFAPEHVEAFLDFYARSEPAIRGQAGCLALSLLRETGDEAAFATWSTWRSGRDLQRYRRSPFFCDFWPAVKAMLREPAEAMSYEILSGDAIPHADLQLAAHDAG